MLDIMGKPNSTIVLLYNYKCYYNGGKEKLAIIVTLKIMSPTNNFQCCCRWQDIENCL
jgi:hypothetical protein